MNVQQIHFPDTNSLQYAESASQVKYLAKISDDGAARFKTLANPSNYAWYALAQWVSQKGHNYIVGPQVPDDLLPAW